jgi:hypothetical protein
VREHGWRHLLRHRLKIFPAQEEAYGVKASSADARKVPGDFGGIEAAPPGHRAADRPVIDAKTKGHVYAEAGVRP